MPEPVEIPLADVLAGLEGEKGQDFSANIGVDPGTYLLTINNVIASQSEFKNAETGIETTYPVALFDLTFKDPKYLGWKRNHKLPIGKRKDNGQWADSLFRASVRKVLGEALYKAQIEPLGTMGERYKKSFELLKGKDCRVFFQKAKKDKDNPNASAWPTGPLMSASEGAAPTTNVGGTEL